MGRLYLDATLQDSDPASTNLKYLREDDTWAAPDTEHRFLDAAGEWTVPEIKGGNVYGVSFPGFPEVTKGVRTDDATGFGDVHPAVSNGTGDSPFDGIWPWSGMVVENRVGGRMVAIPKFWYKLTQNGDCADIQIADYEAEGFHVSPAHMDRNDGVGERDVVYVGRYHCAKDTYKSTSGVLPASNVQRSLMFSKCKDVGPGYYMIDFAMLTTIWILYLVECAEWNSQALIGNGCGNGSSSEAMGYTDRMRYHTGTTKDSPGTYGLGTQYRNIEGLWDNVKDCLTGVYSHSTRLSREACAITDLGALDSTSDGSVIGPTVTGGSCCDKIVMCETTPCPMLWAGHVENGTNRYNYGTSDAWNMSSNLNRLVFGGCYQQIGLWGLFAIGTTIDKGTDSRQGTRLMELPAA